MNEIERDEKLKSIIARIKEMDDTKHHPNSPSSQVAKAQCPSFENTEVGEPAYKGTLLHYCMLDNLMNGKPYGQDVEALVKDALEIELITEEDIRSIYWAVEELDSVIFENTDLITENESVIDAVKTGKANTERMVHLYDDNFEVVNFGTLDLDFSYVIADLKTGQQRNALEQMANYAWAKFQESPQLDKILVIELYSGIQKSHPYWLTLENCKEILEPVFKRVADPDKKPKQCDYCSWCKKRTTCNEVMNKVEELQNNREEIPKEFSFRSSEVVKSAMGALDAFHHDPDSKENKKAVEKHVENLEYLFRCGKAAEAFLGGVKASIKKAMDYGIEIPGLGLEYRSGSSEVKDISEAFAFSGLEGDEFMKLVSISVAKLHTKFEDPKTLINLFDKYGISIPEALSGKTKPLLKSNTRKALEHLLDFKGILTRGKTTSSLKLNKHNTSARKLKATQNV